MPNLERVNWPDALERLVWPNASEPRHRRWAPGDMVVDRTVEPIRCGIIVDVPPAAIGIPVKWVWVMWS